ncbi:MAG: DUF397 domain-containing protein [Acidimicrobiales bacterium]
MTDHLVRSDQEVAADDTAPIFDQRLANGHVILRTANSDAVLEFTPEEWAAFVAGVKDGEFG